MPSPNGRYLCSQATLLKAGQYLASLISGDAQPGKYLQKVLADARVNVHDLTAKQLIAFLMNTRLPKVFAESGTAQDGSDWNMQETSILGDVSFSTTETYAFNNGAHYGGFVGHPQPLEVNFLFMASSLLVNGRGNQTCDMQEVLVGNKINDEAFFKLYERRFLPGLRAQNKQANIDGKQLVINIPGLGCGMFAGEYESEVRRALPLALKRLFDTYGPELNMLHTVNYDPYLPLAEDTFTSIVPNTNIRLMARPLTRLPIGAVGQVASQLEFPKDGTDYSNCRLVKVVAWDHFSYPGNDIWVNGGLAFGNGRMTDDGVSFASSDVILAMFALGQFYGLPVTKVFYDDHSGIAYALDPRDPSKIEPISYADLARMYPSEVTEAMLDIEAALIPRFEMAAAAAAAVEPELAFEFELPPFPDVSSEADEFDAAFVRGENQGRSPVDESERKEEANYLLTPPDALSFVDQDFLLDSDEEEQQSPDAIETARREAEQRQLKTLQNLDILSQFTSKLDAMREYANKLCPGINGLALAFEKAQTIRKIILEIEARIDSFQLRILKSDPQAWMELKESVLEVMNNIKTNGQYEILATHRAPVIRWLKEILCIIVGAIATLVRAAQLYSADKDAFSWKQVPFGLFSNTTSVNKCIEATETLNLVVDQGIAACNGEGERPEVPGF